MKRRFWLIHRAEKVPDVARICDVAKILKVTERTIRNWTEDKYFLAAGVAWKEDDGWHWSARKLRLWIIAMCKTGRLTTRKTAHNPPEDATKDRIIAAAREALGIPIGYGYTMFGEKKEFKALEGGLTNEDYF